MARYRFNISGDLVSSAELDAVASWLHHLAPALPGEFLTWVSDETYNPHWLAVGLRLVDVLAEADHRRAVDVWEQSQREQGFSPRSWSDAPEPSDDVEAGEQVAPRQKPGPYSAPSVEARELRSRVLEELVRHPRADQIDVVGDHGGRFSLVTPPGQKRRGAFEVYGPAGVSPERTAQAPSTATFIPGTSSTGGFDFVHVAEGVTATGSVRRAGNDRFTVHVDGAAEVSIGALSVDTQGSGRYLIDVSDLFIDEFPMRVKT